MTQDPVCVRVCALGPVCLVDVLFGQAGVCVLLQVAADPVAGVKLVGRVERTRVAAALVSGAGSGGQLEVKVQLVVVGEPLNILLSEQSRALR